MVKIKKQTREIINIAIVLLIAGLLLFFYVIYPLGRAKAIMGRDNIEQYTADSLKVNDPAAFVAVGLAADTFRVEADGLTKLACLRVTPAASGGRTARGTVVLVPDEHHNRDSLAPLARLFVDSGFVVISYDQRASGRTTGTYHGEGAYEAGDMSELIRDLELRSEIVHPLSVIGFSLGGDAALLAAPEEKRIERLVAVEPYLTTPRMFGALARENHLLWFPFRTTLLWWWYNIRSGYAAPYRDIESLRPVACRTLLFVPESRQADKEVSRLKELSSPGLLTVKPLPPGEKAAVGEIMSFLAGK